MADAPRAGSGRRGCRRDRRVVRPLRNTRAVAPVETLLLIAFAVGGLVAMAIYLQRAYQGYLYANASAHGMQFDPKGNFTATQRLDNFSQVTDIDITSGRQAIQFFGGDDDLPTTQGGSAPQQALGLKVKVVTTWEAGSEGTYNAKRR